MAPDLIESTAHGGGETRSGIVPGGGVSEVVGGSEPGSRRGQEGWHPEKGSGASIANGRNGLVARGVARGAV